MRGDAGSSDVADVPVTVGAAARSDLVVTSDPDDLEQLRDALHVRLRLQPI